MHLYIPVFNSEEFLTPLEVDQAFRVTIFDNHSSDQTVAISQRKGWQVEPHETTTTRVHNWARAIRHLYQSQGPAWCKWLFTGDELYPDAHSMLTKASHNYPEVRLIIAEYDIMDVDGAKHHWQMFPDTRVISPVEAMRLTAERGNWFGSPIGHCFHREGIPTDLSMTHWEWAADMYLCMEIAKQHPVLYLSERVGAFHAHQRKTYSAQKHAFDSRIEEYLLRKQAAQVYFEMTQDAETYKKLLNTIVCEAESRIVESAFARQGAAPHIIRSIPKRHSLKSLGNFRFMRGVCF